MTIKNVQIQVVETAVNAILEGEAVETVFTQTTEVSVNSLKVIQAFDLNIMEKSFQTDFEVALLTLEAVAQNIVDMYDMSIFLAVADNHDFDEACDIIENERVVVYHDVYNMADLAEQYLHETDSLQHVAIDGNYIDEAQLLHDLYCGGDIQDYHYHLAYDMAIDEGKEEEEAQQIASDYDITSEDEACYMEMVLDSIIHDSEWLQRYFDYEAYGRDMEIDGTFYDFSNGIIEITW